MLLPAFDYVRPESLDEAVELLAESRNARVLAGGQTLLNALKLRLVEPERLVDITRLEELHAIEREPDGSLRIGAAATYDEIAHSPLVQELHPFVAQMSSRLVDRQVRSRGTIGGNVCLADPLSNYPPLVVALGATLVLRDRDGTREVAAGDFFIAPYVTRAGTGALLTEVVLPPLAPDQGLGYESLQVGIDSWALARASALVRCNGTISEARVVLGCGSVPVRQPAMEAALIGAAPSDETVSAATELAGEDFDPPSDVHASSEFRLAMAKTMAGRAVASALEGATAA